MTLIAQSSKSSALQREGNFRAGIISWEIFLSTESGEIFSSKNLGLLANRVSLASAKTPNNHQTPFSITTVPQKF